MQIHVSVCFFFFGWSTNCCFLWYFQRAYIKECLVQN